jgi:hypothetical protein
VEYCYGGGGGIMQHRPRQPPMGAAPGQQAQATPFRVQVRVGDVEATSAEVQRVVESLRGAWLGSEYHLLSRNCNCFADELATRLCGRRIPGWINRLAALGVYFSCLLPPEQRPPVGAGAGAGPSRGSSSSSSSSVGGSGAVPGASGAGRVVGGGSGGASRAGGGGAAPSAEEARAQRAAAAERRQGGALLPAMLRALPAAEEEGETAPLSARGR